ncbi:hypothetical protein AVEN_134839-1 [Araneus ventricosus]|uniref:Uncharacterized protein n=1 Tax=Araneus ventricosus TaxID=182803 RepID=A0A4Y2N6C8_ARAVE|nr:hypothetical protein AVEN_134839-1 [Araneus ventricosus]
MYILFKKRKKYDGFSTDSVTLAGDTDLTKNVDATGERSECSLIHRDKVRYPSATLVSETDWRPTPVYGEHYLFP